MEVRRSRLGVGGARVVQGRSSGGRTGSKLPPKPSCCLISAPDLLDDMRMMKFAKIIVNNVCDVDYVPVYKNIFFCNQKIQNIDKSSLSTTLKTAKNAQDIQKCTNVQKN